MRDGHQSLWSANALSTSMIAEIAPVIDRVGFHAIDFTSSTHMAMGVRWHRDDPWERIRVVRELMPRHRLGFITPGMRFIAGERAPLDVMRLALRCVMRNGIRRIWVAESMNDVATDLEIARIAKRAGAEEVVVGLVYSISPVHTDDYYAERARLIGESDRCRRAQPEGPGRAADARARAHARAGVARGGAERAARSALAHDRDDGRAASYLEAAQLGASFVCTAVRPLANGTSQPSAEQTAREPARSGLHGRDRRRSSSPSMSAYFSGLARGLGRPVGVPLEYDVSVYAPPAPRAG